MSKAASEKVLGELHKLLADKLKEALRSEEATASIMNVARQFLKDNGIEAGPENQDMAEIAEMLDSMDFTGTDG